MTERDDEICSRYMAGETLQAVATRFNLSRMRVKQIVKKAGLWRKRAEAPAREYLGVNLAPETKDALRMAASEQGVSMSKLTADALDAALRPAE